MSDRQRLARDTTVGAAEALLAIGPLLAPLEADLRDVFRMAALQPATRLIGVVDSSGRLAGVIPVTRVAESIVARVVPESLFIDVEDAETAAEFSHSLEDRLAADIMLPAASARATDTIGEAFRLMHRRHLGGVYVVDAENRPTGYLDLLELAVVYVRALDDIPAPDDTASTAGPTEQIR